MSRIIHSPLLKRHIDLDKIAAISDAYFMDHMGSGGWFVGFEIHMQLLDKPIKWARGFAEDEKDYSYTPGHHNGVFYLVFTDGSKDTRDSVEGKTILAVDRLQREIDELVRLWRGGDPLVLDIPASPYAHDFDTHYEAWRKALEIAHDAADSQTDESYWEHELNAYDRAFISCGIVSINRQRVAAGGEPIEVLDSKVVAEPLELETEGVFNRREFMANTDELQDKIAELGRGLTERYGPGRIETSWNEGNTSLSWKWVPDGS